MKSKKESPRILDGKPNGPAAKKVRRIAATVLVAGSFDPVTNGHMTLVDRAAARYKKVYAVIFINDKKEYRYPLETRFEMLKAACAKYPNVTVDANDGMLWAYARDKGITLTIRGYRNESDLAYEKQMALFNERALPTLKTRLIRSEAPYEHVSSTYVKSVLDSGGDPRDLVPEEAIPILLNAEKARKSEK